MKQARSSVLLLGSVLLACSGEVGSTVPGDSSLAPDEMFQGNDNVSNIPGAVPSAGASTTPSTAGETVSPPPGEVDYSQFGPAPFDLRGEPIYSRAVPLTNSQWANAVQDILNLPEPPAQANSFLKPSGGFSLFPNNERVLEVSNSLRESYQLAAAEVADAVVSTPGGVDRIGAGADADSFIRTLGRRAFRRPLSDDEMTRYREAFDVGAALSGDGSEMEKGAGLVIEAMLQSPNFLYRTELAPTGQPLNSFEMASKLSFWLLNTTPSDMLLDRAESGELATEDGAAAVAQEMLEDPAAAEMAVDMFAEMFKFIRYRTIVKSVPEYVDEMGTEAEEASRLFFRDIYENGHGLREALTSTEGYVGPELAELYGVTPPATVMKTELGAERVGFFSQVPYLMLFGADGKADAIHRGLFINYQVLCAQLPEPNFDLPEPKAATPGQTDRQYIQELTGECGAACHGAYINPLGFAFENFDGMGRTRDMDAGQVVDTYSAYPFANGAQAFNGSPELMELLVESDQAHACFAKNIASLGLQRDIVAEDQALLDSLATYSKSEQGSMKNVILELVKAPAFRTRERGAL